MDASPNKEETEMMKKTLACLLAVLQLVLLAPMTAQAAHRAETPVLNETIVGAVQYPNSALPPA